MWDQRPARRFEDHRLHVRLLAQSAGSRNDHIGSGEQGALRFKTVADFSCFKSPPHSKSDKLLADPDESFFLFGVLGVLDFFKGCKAVAAEAHFFSGAIAHIGIVWIIKFLQEDKERDCVSAPRGARHIQATDAHVTDRVNSVLSRKLPVEAPDGGGEIVVSAGNLLTFIEHGFYFLRRILRSVIGRGETFLSQGIKFGKFNTARFLRRVT